MPEHLDRCGRLMERTLTPWNNLQKLLQKRFRDFLAIFCYLSKLFVPLSILCTVVQILQPIIDGVYKIVAENAEGIGL